MGMKYVLKSVLSALMLIGSNEDYRQQWDYSRYEWGLKQTNFNPDDFIVSVEPTTWYKANGDCHKLFDGQGQLLSIESKEKLYYIVKKILGESDSSATDFWTSGRFDRSRKCWKWANEDSFEYWLSKNWGKGYPTSNPAPETRVTFHYESPFYYWLQTEDANRLERYICERVEQTPTQSPTFPVPTKSPTYPPPTSAPSTPSTSTPTTSERPPWTPSTLPPWTISTLTPPTNPTGSTPTPISTPPPTPRPLPSNQCTSDQDLIIVLDNNLSLNTSSYIKSLAFVSKLALEWQHQRKQNRLGFLVFSSGVTWRFNLNNKIPIDKLELEVMSAITIPRDERRSIHSGMKAALVSLEDIRPKINNVSNILLITNGLPDIHMRQTTVDVARHVLAEKIHLFAVGIGPSNFGTFDNELIQMVGGVRRNMIRVDSFDILIKLVDPVVRKLCPDQN